MKQLVLIAVLLAAVPFYGSSQGLALNAGETYTLEFNNFQLEIPNSPNSPTARVLVGRQNFTGSFEFQAFENNLSESSIFSAVVTPSDSSDFYFGPAWQDLQGVIRIDMLSGSMTMPVILGAVTLPGGNVYSESVTPVPEPGGLSLLLAAGLPVVLRRKLEMLRTR